MKTPVFDRLAREGLLCENAFVVAPSCTPSRNAILTGKYHWQLEEGVNLYSTLHPRFPVFPLMLRNAGYFVGHWRKSWGPGQWNALGRKEDPTGPTFNNFEDFLKKRPQNKPFCFWFGSSDPHRPYELGSGKAAGIDPNAIQMPADLPDHTIVRNDIADYYFEVERWDREVGQALQLLKKTGELNNTIIVMTGDHGMPFPRHKNQLYDSGTHVCLAIRWGNRIKAGQRVTDFISLPDLAATFLEAGGVQVPEAMTAQSLIDIFDSKKSGRIDPLRNHVLVGRERHAQDQEKPNPGGYPMRGIRTDDYLYIRNFAPDRWPGGCPDPELAFNGIAYCGCDASPSKDLLIARRDEPEYSRYYKLAFAKRPAEELYDLASDPHQLVNVVDDPKFFDVRQRLAEQLENRLRETGDPRVCGGETYESYPFRRPKRPQK